MERNELAKTELGRTKGAGGALAGDEVVGGAIALELFLPEERAIIR